MFGVSHIVFSISKNSIINIEVKDDLTQNDRELLMKLSPAYLRWREDTLEQGRQEGREKARQECLEKARQEGYQEGYQQGYQQGKQECLRQMIQSFFKVRFGSIDEELSAIVEPMLQLPQDELASLLLAASKEELLERFGK